MTQEDKKEIRDKKFLDYCDAVDNLKAHCGRLSEIIKDLRFIVTLYDEKSLKLKPPTNDAPPPFDDESRSGLRLPTMKTWLRHSSSARRLRMPREEPMLTL